VRANLRWRQKGRCHRLGDLKQADLRYRVVCIAVHQLLHRQLSSCLQRYIADCGLAANVVNFTLFDSLSVRDPHMEKSLFYRSHASF
jgi:hypothetical protein